MLSSRYTRRSCVRAASAALLFLAACGGDRPVGPVACTLDNATELGLGPYQGGTFSSAEACVALPGQGARYMVVPQLASAASSAALFSYVVGAPADALAGMRDHAVYSGQLQQQFDIALRMAEARLPAPSASKQAYQMGASPMVLANVAQTRTFRVLSTLDTRNPTYATVTAHLRYNGTSIALYVDQDAPPPPQGFSELKLQELGRHFDLDLFPLGIQRFGTVSDIDGNGKVFVLMTPVVNSLSDRAECATQGFVSGFFFGADLSSTASTSNKAEIYYSAVPDPGGEFGCALSPALIERVAPATFIHELQHMISYNHHVLQRRGNSEVLWLNEGLSHIAEEFASRHYEDRYPPPFGRTNPTQLFPDSAQGFISGNLVNAYRYLRNPAATSVTSMTGFGGLSERGASWLFLRWLGDQKGDDIFRQMVQTSRTGIDNVQVVAGESFEQLFADFSLAIWGDSIPGVPRAMTSQRHRFKSRNLRQVFQALWESRNAGGPDPAYPTPFPLVPRTLGAGTALNDALVRGTMDYFILDTQAGGEPAIVRFTSPSGTPLARDLRGQVGILRTH